MNLRLRLLLEWFLIGVISTLFVFSAQNWRGTASFDNLFYDQLSSISRPAPNDNILIAAIDDESLSQLGKWPWPRDVMAQAITRLKNAKPRSLTVDILYSEEGDAQADDALAQAIAAAPRSFIPLHFTTPGSNGRPYDTEMPTAKIADAAQDIGHVNLTFDDDGSLRRAALCFDPENGKQTWPHLMELVYRSTNGGSPSPEYQRSECGTELLLPYTARGGFSEISISSLLNSQVPEDLIEGRDVIIGATATGLGDSYPVPFADGGLLSGSEIMANMLSALRADSFIAPVGKNTKLVLSILPIWLLLLLFLKASPRTALVASVLVLIIIIFGSAMALQQHFWFPPGSALMGILLIYPLWGWRRLQAVSNFMNNELSNLQKDDEITPFSRRMSAANDMVGRQTAALGNAIGQIRELRQFVGDVLSDLPDPMVVTDNDGLVTLASDMVQERIGQQIVGLKLHSVLRNGMSAEQWSMVEAFLAKDPAESEGRAFIRFETIDGRSFVMRQSLAVNDTDQEVGRISYFTDITALARAEAEREEVLQLLSHDMRAPQSAIIASLQGRIDKATRGRIKRNAERTMRLAQDFVDMARMAETKFDGEAVLLFDLARDVADNLWALAQEREVTVNIEDKSDAAFVIAEAEQLSRAITNLIDNAIKFSPAGSNIDVAIHRTDIAGESHVSMVLHDAGPGIDAELLPKLFDRFATSDIEKRRVKGTGLGLSYVEAVAGRHGGSIRAENGPDGGARFTLILPEAVGLDDEL